MSCIAWNCCGLENLRIGREVVEITRAKNLSVVFLAETLTDEARLEIVQQNIDFKYRRVVPREGRGGGLVLYWKLLINLTVEASGKYYIDAIIDKNTENAWRLTSFYEEPETARRIEAWNKLRSLNSQPDIPWLCVGDFNKITRQDEKVGGAIRPQNQMQLFRDEIDECKFIDLGYVGPKFTWSRHFENDKSIWERLDRGLATNNWFLKFLGSWVYHFRCDSSDRCPLHVTFTNLIPPSNKKLFKFEEMWLSNSRCEEIVRSARNSTCGAGIEADLVAKVDKCGRDLAWWNQNVFGNVRKKLDRLKKMLVQAESVAVPVAIIIKFDN